MDPLSALGVASSVVGVASFGIQLSQVLYQFTTQALSAKESLQSILSGIHATTCALNQVHGILAEECANLERTGRAIFFSAKAIDDVKGTADKCLLIFWRIEATITNKTGSKFEEELIKRLNSFNKELITKKHPNPIKVDTTLISLSTWGRLRWPYIAPKLDNYNSQLHRLQMNLVLMFSVISLGAHRMRPTQREDDLRTLVETYTRIRLLAAQADLAQISQNFGQQRRQESIKLNNSDNMHQLGIESPTRMRFNLKPDQFSFSIRRPPFRKLSLSPSRRPISIAPLKPEPLGQGGITNRNILPSQSDKNSMEVRLSASGSTESLKQANTIEHEKRSTDAARNKLPEIMPVDVGQSSTILANHNAAVTEERTIGKPVSDVFEAVPLIPDKEVAILNAGAPLELLKRDSKLDIEPRLLPETRLRGHIDSLRRAPGDVQPNPVSQDAQLDQEPAVEVPVAALIEPVITRVSEVLLQPNIPAPERRPLMVRDVANSVILPEGVAANGQENQDREPDQLQTSDLGSVSQPLSHATTVVRGDSASRVARTLARGSDAVDRTNRTRQDDPLWLSPRRQKSVDTNSRTQLDNIDGSQAQSLPSYRQARDKVQSASTLSWLKSILSGKQLVSDAFLTAYIIKKGEAYQLPKSRTWRLNRAERKSLQYQSTEPSWYKIFAFLDEGDMAALQEIVSQTGSDGTECKGSIVHLRKIKEGRLRFKFWKAAEQAVFAIIRSSQPEPSISNSNLDLLESSRDIEEIGVESLLELAQQSGLPRPIALTTAALAPGARESFGILQQRGQYTADLLSSQPVTRNPKVFATAQSLPAAVAGPPPPPPPAPYLGALLPPIPPPGQSIRIQDITTRTQGSTPPKLMDQAACLEKLTTFAAFTIRKVYPLRPGDVPTWARAEITHERFCQEDLVRELRKLSGGSRSVAEKKAALEHFQQGQITALLDDLAIKERDRAFEWLLVQINTTTKPTKPARSAKTRESPEIVTLLVYVSRTPLRGLDPVILYQNIERMKADRMRGPAVWNTPAAGRAPVLPDRGTGDCIDRERAGRPVQKIVRMDEPGQSFSPASFTPLPLGASTAKKYHGNDSEENDSESSCSGSSITSVSFTPGSVNSLKRFEGRDKRSPNRRAKTSRDSHSRPHRRNVYRQHSWRGVLRVDGDGAIVTPKVPSNRVDWVTAGYQAGKVDPNAQAEQLRRNRTDDGMASRHIEPRPVISYGHLDGHMRRSGRARSRVDPLPYISHMGRLVNSGPSNHRLDDDDTETLDEDGRDIVQQLLSEWTPLYDDGGEAEKYKRNEDAELETSTAEVPEKLEVDEIPELRGRSPSRRTVPRQENHSRRATVESVDDEVDETVDERSDTDNVPPIASRKAKGKEREHDHDNVEQILGSQVDQRQPSWLHPSWAQHAARITGSGLDVPHSRGGEVPEQRD